MTDKKFHPVVISRNELFYFARMQKRNWPNFSKRVLWISVCSAGVETQFLVGAGSFCGNRKKEEKHQLRIQTLNIKIN